MRVLIAFLAVTAFGALALPWLMFFKRMRKAFRRKRGWKTWRRIGLRTTAGMLGAFIIVVLVMNFWPEVEFTHMDGM